MFYSHAIYIPYHWYRGRPTPFHSDNSFTDRVFQVLSLIYTHDLFATKKNTRVSIYLELDIRQYQHRGNIQSGSKFPCPWSVTLVSDSCAVCVRCSRRTTGNAARRSIYTFFAVRQKHQQKNALLRRFVLSCSPRESLRRNDALLSALSLSLVEGSVFFIYYSQLSLSLSLL